MRETQNRLKKPRPATYVTLFFASLRKFLQKISKKLEVPHQSHHSSKKIISDHFPSTLGGFFGKKKHEKKENLGKTMNFRPKLRNSEFELPRVFLNLPESTAREGHFSGGFLFPPQNPRGRAVEKNVDDQVLRNCCVTLSRKMGGTGRFCPVQIPSTSMIFWGGNVAMSKMPSII